VRLCTLLEVCPHESATKVKITSAFDDSYLQLMLDVLIQFLSVDTFGGWSFRKRTKLFRGAKTLLGGAVVKYTAGLRYTY
jgi:hypothetical protein